MKREALRHPKMLDLAARLRIPREHAIGIVQVLIDWVHDMAPRGDVGKWPNGAIAVACGQTDHHDEFINALIGSGWLDSHPRHRLLVHDYPDHAERFVKAKLAKNRQWFCFAYYINGRKWDAPNGIQPPVDELPKPTDRPPEPTIERTVEPTVPRDQTKPNQTKPNHPQTPAENPAVVAGLVVAGGWDSWHTDSEAAARLALQSCGYKRFNDLVTECRSIGLVPQDIVVACDEYKANATRFSSPGAIAERLRSGVWPANGVVGVCDAARAKSSKASAERAAEIEKLKIRLIKAGDGNARDWDAQQIINRARERGWIGNGRTNGSSA